MNYGMLRSVFMDYASRETTKHVPGESELLQNAKLTGKIFLQCTHNFAIGGPGLNSPIVRRSPILRVCLFSFYKYMSSEIVRSRSSRLIMIYCIY